MIDGCKFLEDEFKYNCNDSKQRFRAEANAMHVEGCVGSSFSSLTTETCPQAKVPKISAQD